MISILKNVPPGWTKVKFQDIAQNVTDRVDVPSDSGLEYYIGLEHLDTDQIRIKRFGSTDEVKATKFICKKGDIIFGKRRAYLRKLAVTDREAVVSAHSMVLRSKGNLIHPDFLPCFMQSSIFWRTAHAISEGSMSPTIKWKTLAKQEFWIPSLSEQKKILGVLSAVEGNIEKNERLININTKLREELLNRLLLDGLMKTKSKKVRFNGQEISIADSAVIQKLKDVCDRIFVGIATSTTKHYSDQTGIPILRNQDIAEHRILEKDLMYITQKFADMNKTRFLKEGDVISVRTGYPGLSVVVPKKYENCHTFTTLISRPNKEMLDSHYLCYFLNSSIGKASIKRMLVGSAQKNLNVSFMEKIEVIVPRDIEEQRRISNIMKSLYENTDSQVENKEILQKVKRKLTNEYMSGKLRVPPEALKNVQ